jgi:hypothetical protein
MTPAIILGTIFFIIIIFLASIGLYELIKFAISDSIEALVGASIIAFILYGMLIVGFIKYILFTFK